jgi:2-(1,2-epoxy-1,2-dihydrophenyl)acetyl-CoA isomerase
MYENILYEVSEGIATITLNRPEKRNAYTPEMGEEVCDAFTKLRADDAVRVAILTGAGKGFCAGVDLDRLKALQAGTSAGKGPSLGEDAFVTELPRQLLAFPKPVIAAINGAAIGVGATMVLPCDIRIAAAGAKIGFTFTDLGILPGLGSTHLLPRLVGRAKALELVLTAKVILAEEAAQIGLVNAAVPADELANAARALARTMAEKEPPVLAAAKAILNFGESAGMEQAMLNEKAQSAELRKAHGR